jgi:hypothetical protein
MVDPLSDGPMEKFPRIAATFSEARKRLENAGCGQDSFTDAIFEFDDRQHAIHDRCAVDGKCEKHSGIAI